MLCRSCFDSWFRLVCGESLGLLVYHYCLWTESHGPATIHLGSERRSSHSRSLLLFASAWLGDCSYCHFYRQQRPITTLYCSGCSLYALWLCSWASCQSPTSSVSDLDIDWDSLTSVLHSQPWKWMHGSFHPCVIVSTSSILFLLRCWSTCYCYWYSYIEASSISIEPCSKRRCLLTIRRHHVPFLKSFSNSS